MVRLGLLLCCPALYAEAPLPAPRGKPREIHLSTAVSSARYAVRHGLNVGTPVAAVKRLLGPPESEEEGEVFYKAGEFQGVAFRHANGAITRVERLTFPDREESVLRWLVPKVGVEPTCPVKGAGF